ncbi:polyketide synthase dehydratase domain-containing protein, partial [Streptomyces sp. NPDC001193]
ALHAHGATVDWTALFAGVPVRRIELPTYAFQHERYWMDALSSSVGDVSAAGLGDAEHPLLSAVVVLPDDNGAVLTGRLSVSSLPWLADHIVGETVLFPGTGFVELALRAGDEVGCEVLDELTLQAPLVLPQHGAVHVQVVVGAPDETGARTVTVHSRPEGDSELPWTPHAEGRVAPGDNAPGFDLSVWPPEDTTPLGVDDAYEVLRGYGYGYGPVFQGLRAAWQSGDALFAEVSLPEQAHAEAVRFGLHPALLDACLHAAIVAGDSASEDETVLPFSWAGVRLHATGATTVRVKVTPTAENSIALVLADGTGAPVASVEALTSRPVSAEQLSAGQTAVHPSLYKVDWTKVAAAEAAAAAWPDWETVAADAGVVVPEAVVLRVAGGSGVDEVRGATHR